MRVATRPVRLWGSELSPFTLKLRALLAYAEVPYRMLPEAGGRCANYRALATIELAKRRRTAVRYPALSDLDEYPLVPFLLADSRVYYDSSALARWLDARYRPAPGPFVPGDPALAFVAQLIDEAFDEFGLYLVHHARWVVSATTNDAGARLARELARVLPPGAGPLFAQRFAARQVRRLPYLFSAAPPDFAVDGLPSALTPPARADFPPTHRLIAHAWPTSQRVPPAKRSSTSRPLTAAARSTTARSSACRFAPSSRPFKYASGESCAAPGQASTSAPACRCAACCRQATRSQAPRDLR